MKENGEPSANSNKQRYLFLGLVGGIALLIGMGLWFNSDHNVLPEELTEGQDIKYEETGGIREPTAKERLEQRYSIDRNDYSIYLDRHGYDTFGALPEIPEDFGEIAYMVHTGKLFDLDKVTEEYYLQPEFFPLFIANGLKFYKSYDPDYVGTYGWGTYPSEQTVSTSAGGEGKIQFFFKTGWGVETWQGMNLVVNSNCGWVHAEIENPVFVAPPSYPEFCTKESCGEDWARKITIIGKVDANVMKGSECYIYLTTTSPPFDKVREWIDEYGTDYVTASSSMVTAGMPFMAKVIVN